MALEPEALIAAVIAQLQTVSGMGVTHDYRREVRTEQEARTHWLHPEQHRINCWTVTIGEPAVRSERYAGFRGIGVESDGQVVSALAIAIEAVFGIDDAAASEKTFRALCWSVTRKFNRIGLLTSDVMHQDPFLWDRFGYLVLAGMYTVHFARFTCTFQGQVSPA